MRQRLKQALAQRLKPHIVDGHRVLSAVLLLIYDKQGEYHILLTQRTEMVADHKGEISFPGGAYEKQDRTLLNTALRECAEEIGLASEVVELLGELDDVITTTSSYIISPFVATIPWPYSFRADPIETKEIIEVPISAFLDKNCWHHETRTVDGQVVTNYVYHYQDKIIWGATARILNQFLELYIRVMKDNGE